MPTYDIDFEANGKQQRLTVEGTRPPTSEEAGRLIMQALGQQQTPENERVTIDVVKGEGATPVPAATATPMAAPQAPGLFGSLKTKEGVSLSTVPPAQREEVLAQQLTSGIKEGMDEVLPMLGEAGGQLAGSVVLPGVGTAVGGALGAGVGKAAGTLVAEGRLPTAKEVGIEAGLSLVPEVVESAGRGLLRSYARGTRGGGKLRFDEAAQEARQLAGEVFQPQTREAVDQMYAHVRQSGLRVNTDIAEQEIKRHPAGQYDQLLSEVRLLDRQHAAGGRYVDLVERLRTKNPQLTAGYDIGELDRLRSALRIRAEAVDTHGARTMLRDLQDAIDESIAAGTAVGRTQRGMTPEVLQQARVGYARLRAAEDMGDLVERAITSSDNLRLNAFSVRQFADNLRKEQTEITRSVNRALDLTPGARQRFEDGLQEIARHFETIELSQLDTAGIRRMPIIAGIGQAISTILLSETGQRLFRDAVVNGRGAISPNAIALIANAARRDLAPGLTGGGTPSPPPQPATPGDNVANK